jgi:hypothetical protein
MLNPNVGCYGVGCAGVNASALIGQGNSVDYVVRQGKSDPFNYQWHLFVNFSPATRMTAY